MPEAWLAQRLTDMTATLRQGLPGPRLTLLELRDMEEQLVGSWLLQWQLGGWLVEARVVGSCVHGSGLALTQVITVRAGPQ